MNKDFNFNLLGIILNLFTFISLGLCWAFGTAPFHHSQWTSFFCGTALMGIIWYFDRFSRDKENK